MTGVSLQEGAFVNGWSVFMRSAMFPMEAFSCKYNLEEIII